MTDQPSNARPLRHGAVPVALLLTLAVQNAVPPFSTDMYTPAFPEVASSLATTSTLIGLTLTAFFIGLGSGQMIGGAASDQLGRRLPLLAGGLTCALGGVICALSPTVGVLIVGRFLQGLGGGAAAAVGRAILVDVAHGKVLARTMSLLQALGGLAPMIAPVAGGLVITHAPWRTIFWFLTAFGLLMSLTAWRFVPETMPTERRHHGGLGRFLRGVGAVMRVRTFVGYMTVSALSGFCMFAYIANSSFVFQDQLGTGPLLFSVLFALNALVMVVLTLANARLVNAFSPSRLIIVGLSISASAVVLLTLTFTLWGTPLVAVCVGFALVMGAQAFIFGNSAALALGAARENAGVASAVQGLAQSLANAVAAPLATAGGPHDSLPMLLTMIAGIGGAWLCLLLVARRAPRR